MVVRSKRKAELAEESAPSARERNSLAEWAVTILLLLFGTTTLAQAFVIPTGSMEDTLLVGDHVLVDKLTYAPSGAISRYLLPYSEPKHGDIIVFRAPGSISEMLVKRLIGVPGDHIRMQGFELYRNGLKVNEPYVFHKYGSFHSLPPFPQSCCLPVKNETDQKLQEDMLKSMTNGELVIPPGHYFAMGDNRENSYDSRFWGFVPQENIVGKPFLIYWSYDASTEDLTGQTAGSVVNHLLDLGQHFFTRTRWSRTLNVIRGVPDSNLH